MHTSFKLEPRLQAAADFIQTTVHADIGSDHAKLPLYLLATGRAKRVIAIEKTKPPFERSRRALCGLTAEVRLGNGLEPLGTNEADSLSMCGMGARTILKILEAQPAKQSARMVLQANDKPELLRRWAYDNGFQLQAECMVTGFWRYVILSLVRTAENDPAYAGFAATGQLELAFRFGPHLLSGRHKLLYEELLSQQEEYEKLGASKNPLINDRLNLLCEALAYYD